MRHAARPYTRGELYRLRWMRRQRRRELARSALLAAAITSCCLATLVGCLMACSLLRWPDLPSVIASVLTSTAITTAMILLVSPRNGR